MLRHTAELERLQKERESCKQKPAKRQKVEKTVSKQQASKCLKWRIFPNGNQKKTLNLWLETTRWIFNKAVDHFNKTQDSSLQGLRNAVGISNDAWRGVNANGQQAAPARMHEVPYEIRDSPIQDVHKACATLRAKEKKKKQGKKAVLKFRKKKDDKTSFTLGARQLNCKTERAAPWASLFGTCSGPSGRNVMQCEGSKSTKGPKGDKKPKKLPLLFEHDCRLVYERATKRFFLCIPVNSPETQGRKDGQNTEASGIVAIDPGIRTFATCYRLFGENLKKEAKNQDHQDLENHSQEENHQGENHDEEEVVEWGKAPRLLGWLSRKADRLDRKAKAAHGRSRKRVRAVAARVRQRITDLASELHRKLARWLCANHKVILLPKFSPRQIARRKDLPLGKRRAIGKKTARRLYQLGHYRFRVFLTHKAKELGCTLVVCDEYWTSKTCGSCGATNPELGKQKTFRCGKCGFVCDRDANAARNVLLRYISVNNIEI